LSFSLLLRRLRTRPKMSQAVFARYLNVRTKLVQAWESDCTTEGTLTPAQLKRELQRIAWGQVRLAQKLGVWPSEVRDWLAGKEPVPEVVASDIRHLPSRNLRPPRTP